MLSISQNFPFHQGELIDVDSRGEVNHICLLLGHASMQQVEEVIHICLLFRSRIYAAGREVKANVYYRKLVTRVTPSCYPPLKVQNYFLNGSSKITEKSTFLLTHFDDCS